MTPTSPMLALAPGTCSAPGPGANTGCPVFFLGTHQPGWLTTAPVPPFISDRRLRCYKTLPRAQRPWLERERLERLELRSVRQRQLAVRSDRQRLQQEDRQTRLAERWQLPHALRSGRLGHRVAARSRRGL